MMEARKKAVNRVDCSDPTWNVVSATVDTLEVSDQFIKELVKPREKAIMEIHSSTDRQKN